LLPRLLPFYPPRGGATADLRKRLGSHSELGL
jgi:hypothetical protein